MNQMNQNDFRRANIVFKQPSTEIDNVDYSGAKILDAHVEGSWLHVLTNVGDQTVIHTMPSAAVKSIAWATPIS